MNEEILTNRVSPIEAKRTGEYPRQFFELQIQFAQKIARVLNIPISQALLEYTNLYPRFNLGRKPDANNPIWQEFIASINDKNIFERTYEFYHERKDIKLERRLEKKDFGCFTCEYKPGEECARVHFGNRETQGSPFDDANLVTRLKELKSMFQYVKDNCPEAKVVRGSSWLYNLPKYKRFFPPEYTRDPKPDDFRFTGLSSWGQFIDKDMKIKPEALSSFQQSFAKATSLNQIFDSLPLKTLKVETKVEDFYNFYGIH